MINVFNLLTFKIFLIPCPIFVGYLSISRRAFGVILIGIEFRIKYILKHFEVLTSCLGRGLFNI